MTAEKFTYFSSSGAYNQAPFFRFPIQESWSTSEKIRVNYTPFGVTLKGRNLKKTGLADKFRFGFNGKEVTDEWSGEGNSYDFGARMYDTRLGRWLSIDPKSGQFPFESAYIYTSDNPVIYIDKEGEFKIPIHVEITLTALASVRPLNYLAIVLELNETFTQTMSGNFHEVKEKFNKLNEKTRENFAIGMAYGVSIDADIFGCLDPNNHFDGMKYNQIAQRWTELDNQLNSMKIERTFDSGAEFGKALHAVEDFYAHSNYIELYLDYYKEHNGGKLPDPNDIPLFQDVIKIDKKFKAILEEKLVTGHMDIPTYLVDQVAGTTEDIDQTHNRGDVHHDDIAKDNESMGKDVKGKNRTVNTFEAAKVLAGKNAELYINKKLSTDGTK